jgi:hypothetical protein
MAINNEEDDAPKSNSTVQILISYKKEYKEEAKYNTTTYIHTYIHTYKNRSTYLGNILGLIGFYPPAK